MSPTQNSSFETAGTGPGLAANWTVTTVSTAIDYATYGLTSIPLESFEQEWNNDSYIYIFTLAMVETALFDTGTQNTEDFEDEWSNTTYHVNWSTVAFAWAMFDTGAQAVEDFEDEWNNTTYHTDWSTVGVAAAMFADGAEADETFEAACVVLIALGTGQYGADKTVDETGAVIVEVTGGFVASLQVQSKYENTWRDEGDPLTAPGTVELDTSIKAVRFYTVSYTSGVPDGEYNWGQMDTI